MMLGYIAVKMLSRLGDLKRFSAPESFQYFRDLTGPKRGQFLILSHVHYLPGRSPVGSKPESDNPKNRPLPDPFLGQSPRRMA